MLGVDVGTTFTAAAVWRDGRGEIVTLGSRSTVIPTVVVADADGHLVTGEAAERRAAREPGRAAREVKRRLGDSTPLLLGGSPYSAQALLAAVLSDVVRTVSVEQGGPPERIGISHPANWGPFKRELVNQIVELAGLDASTTVLVTEPEAAAVYYASAERLPPGSVVAVYDLGGGTFDTAVVRIADTGLELLGTPHGIEHLGGIDFDAAVLGQVRESLGLRLDALDPEAPATEATFARLRDACVRAKEALSADPDAVVEVALPDGPAEVRITRSELEALVRPALEPTVEALRRAIGSAGLTPDDIDRVLLVGGSSRIPVVGEVVASTLGRPVAVDAHPKHAVALGAAAMAAGEEQASGFAPLGSEMPVGLLSERRRARRLAFAAVAALLLVIGLVAGLVATRDPGERVSIDPAEADGATTTTGDDDGTTTSSTDTTVPETVTSIAPNGDTVIVTVPTTQRRAGTTTQPSNTTSPTVAVTATTVQAPGAPLAPRTTNAQVTQVNGANVATSVSVSLQWSAPNSGGAATSYRIYRTHMVGASAQGGAQLIASSVTSTSTTVTVSYSDSIPANSWFQWQVSAVNGGGESSAVGATATVVDVIGEKEWNGYAVLRNAGVLPGGGAPLNCGRALSDICQQSVAGGASRAAGTPVTIQAQS